MTMSERGHALLHAISRIDAARRLLSDARETLEGHGLDQVADRVGAIVQQCDRWNDDLRAVLVRGDDNGG